MFYPGCLFSRLFFAFVHGQAFGEGMIKLRYVLSADHASADEDDVWRMSLGDAEASTEDIFHF